MERVTHGKRALECCKKALVSGKGQPDQGGHIRFEEFDLTLDVYEDFVTIHHVGPHGHDYSWKTEDADVVKECNEIMTKSANDRELDIIEKMETKFKYQGKKTS